MNSEKTLISVVITTYNEEENIKLLLDSIVTQTYSNYEIVIVDSERTTDNTLSIAKKYDCKTFTYGQERSPQRNYAVKKSTGQYVIILDADMKLDKTVLEDCIHEISSAPNIKSLIIPEKSFGNTYWAKCKALERNCYIGDETIEAARLFDRNLYLKMGGFNKDMISGEDWDLTIRFRKAGYKIGRINSFIHHNEGDMSLIKTIKKKAYYAEKSDEYISQNVGGIKQIFLFVFRPAYFRNWKLLLRDPFHTVGFMIMKFLELLVGAISILKSQINKGTNND